MADYTQPDDVLKRVRFFDGQYLVDQDFIDEQRYHLDRERRTARVIGLAGVVEGLAVTATAGSPYQVTVAPGSAVDPAGRHLLLTGEVRLTLTADSFSGVTGVQIRLFYAESATDLAQSGGSSNRRFEETPTVAAIAGTAIAVAPADAPTRWDTDGVLLGQVSVSAKGDVAVDQAVVATRAGLDPPGPFRGPVSVRRDLAVGAAAAWNPAGWNRVVDVYGDQHARYLVRTAGTTGFLAAHPGWNGAPGGVMAGSETDAPFTVMTANAPRLTVTGGPAGSATTGRVGIGTTAPTARLHVSGGGGTNVDLVVNGRLRSDSNDGGLWVSNDRFVGGYGDRLGLYTGGAFQFVVTKEGHAGFGTGEPQSNAAWTRTVEVYGDSASRITARTKTITAVTGAHPSGYGATAGWLGGTESDHSATLFTNGAARLTVLGGKSDAGGGQVGIGTTKPAAKLHVAGGGGTNVDLIVNGRLRSDNIEGGLWVTADRFVGGVDKDKIGFFNGGAWALAVTAQGHVGIGTTNPLADTWARVLDVTAKANARVVVRSDDGPAVGFLAAHPGGAYDKNSPGGLYIGTDTPNNVTVVTGRRIQLTVTREGNVGIGTYQPTMNGDWSRAVDLYGDRAARFLVRNGNITGVLGVHDNAYFAGGQRGLVVGTENDGATMLVSSGQVRLTVFPDGNVSVGSTKSEPAKGFDRTLEVFEADSATLAVRTNRMRGVFGIAESQLYTDWPPQVGRAWRGLVAGTEEPVEFSLMTASQRRVTLGAGGDVYVHGTLWLQPASNWGTENQFGPTNRRWWFTPGRDRWNTNDPTEGGAYMRRGNEYTISDGRLKEDVRELAGATAVLSRLRGVTYRWNDEGLRVHSRLVEEQYGAGPDATEAEHAAVRAEVRAAVEPALRERREVGLIAQEVEAVLPELVATDAEGVRGIDYEKLTAVLVQAVKELQDRLETVERNRNA